MLRFCIFTLLVLLSAIAASRVVQAESAPAAFDLAAMSLVGEDFVSVGWDGLEFVADWNPTAADLADRAVWPAGTGEDLDDVETRLIAAGWQQSFAATFAAPPDLDHGVPGRQAEVEIVAYGDDRGADAGFARIPDAFPTGPIAAVTSSQTFGEESRLVRVAARDPQAGTPNQELALGFRSGRFTARILLRDWSGEEPAIVTIEALGSRLATRIAQEATR